MTDVEKNLCAGQPTERIGAFCRPQVLSYGVPKMGSKGIISGRSKKVRSGRKKKVITLFQWPLTP